eukprot:4699628-Pyramimonas_sp.AAC.1
MFLVSGGDARHRLAPASGGARAAAVGGAHLQPAGAALALLETVALHAAAGEKSESRGGLEGV